MCEWVDGISRVNTIRRVAIPVVSVDRIESEVISDTLSAALTTMSCRGPCHAVVGDPSTLIR